MQPKGLTVLRFLLGFPLSAVALIFIIRLVLSKKDLLSSSITHVDIFLLVLSVCAFLVFFLLRSVVWYEMLLQKGHTLPFWKTAFLWEMSEMKRYVPGSIWSFIGRIAHFSESQISKRSLAKSVLIEAQLIVVANACVSIVCLPFVFSSVFPQIPYRDILWPLLMIGILVGTLVYIFNKKILPVRYLNLLLPAFSPAHIARMVGLTAVAYAFFGLGSYLTFASFFPLDPRFIPLYISFFSLSYLVGYLALIAPMGLGIREGMVIATMSKFVSVADAGFGAIVARLMLIATELVFLLLTFAMRKKI